MWTSIWADVNNEKDKRRLKEIAQKTNGIYQGIWYHDGKVVYTPKPNEVGTYNLYHAGVAIIAKRDLKAHTELFLDYELNESVLNSHAKEWYEPVPFRLDE